MPLTLDSTVFSHECQLIGHKNTYKSYDDVQVCVVCVMSGGRPLADVRKVLSKCYVSWLTAGRRTEGSVQMLRLMADRLQTYGRFCPNVTSHGRPLADVRKVLFKCYVLWLTACRRMEGCVQMLCLMADR
jgi:hypothetical protein